LGALRWVIDPGADSAAGRSRSHADREEFVSLAVAILRPQGNRDPLALLIDLEWPKRRIWRSISTWPNGETEFLAPGGGTALFPQERG
jgi:hypothetical protein